MVILKILGDHPKNSGMPRDDSQRISLQRKSIFFNSSMYHYIIGRLKGLMECGLKAVVESIHKFSPRMLNSLYGSNISFPTFLNSLERSS